MMAHQRKRGQRRPALPALFSRRARNFKMNQQLLADFVELDASASGAVGGDEELPGNRDAEELLPPEESADTSPPKKDGRGRWPRNNRPAESDDPAAEALPVLQDDSSLLEPFPDAVTPTERESGSPSLKKRRGYPRVRRRGRGRGRGRGRSISAAYQPPGEATSETAPVERAEGAAQTSGPDGVPPQRGRGRPRGRPRGSTSLQRPPLPLQLTNEEAAMSGDSAETQQGATAEDAPGESGCSFSWPYRKRYKNKNKPVVPTLRSSRDRGIKVNTKHFDDPYKDDDTIWTVAERRQLLNALKKHGSSDINKLAAEVPTRRASGVLHFLNERRRMKDRFIVQGPAGARASLSGRVLRKALNSIRRRFDRSREIIDVVSECERQPLSDLEEAVGEVPQVEQIYQCIREVMENHVPARLGPCELWVLRRMLGTVAALLRGLDLRRDRRVLHYEMFRIADSPLGVTPAPPVQPREGDERMDAINFPSRRSRKEAVMSSWNPLGLPPSLLQGQWANIRDALADQVLRPVNPVRPGDLEEQLPRPPGRRVGRPKKSTVFPEPLETFSPW